MHGNLITSCSWLINDFLSSFHIQGKICTCRITFDYAILSHLKRSAAVFNIKTFLSSFFKTSNYVSELDQFFHGFDKNHPRLSSSQRYEREKYKRVYQLRDNKIMVKQVKQLWDKF